uniref:Uncharacterized protein n=1 Tax=Panagrolaimus sp. ES5 TaxID=591445 RepID=A0AC34FDC6_9BILA
MSLCCELEPVFRLATSVNQKCGDIEGATKEIDCQRCCETWGLSKGVGKDKQSGTFDYTNQKCYCCKLQCPFRA